MMTKFPNDDQKLVAFLRQHRPLPSASGEDLEENIMEWVKNHPQSTSQKISFSKRRPLWISSAIAASLLLVWGGSRLLMPTPNYAKEEQELETFMVSTWNDVIGEEASIPVTDSPETVWLSFFEE